MQYHLKKTDPPVGPSLALRLTTKAAKVGRGCSVSEGNGMRIKADGVEVEATVTTDHPASSYGRPVLLVNGAPVGTADAMAADLEIVEASEDEREALTRGGYTLPDAPAVKRWRITNTTTGVDMGVYPGATEAEALDAMSRDAGYKDHADACETTGTDGADLSVIEVDE